MRYKDLFMLYFEVRISCELNSLWPGLPIPRRLSLDFFALRNGPSPVQPESALHRFERHLFGRAPGLPLPVGEQRGVILHDVLFASDA